MNPNILVLLRGFKAGDAITTVNLFSKWPKEHLFCASLVDSEYISKFKDFYLLGDREIRYSFPFNLISSPVKSRHDYDYCEKHRESNGKSIISKVYEQFARPILQWLDLYETRLTIGISDDFDRWLRDINPKIIYTSVGDIAMAEFIIKLHEKYPDIKIVIHGFDDWMSPSYKLCNEGAHRKKAENLFKQILSFADIRFTSSEMMAKDYHEKYGYEFSCFPNPVRIPEKLSKPLIKGSSRIVFTGKVGWHNHNAIKAMMTAVNEIVKCNQALDFYIYTDASQVELEPFLGKIPKSTVIHKPVPNSEISRVLSQASILYLPINIDTHTVKFTKYSMSTKMGEYLSSGIPVIYFGPEGIAMTNFLKSRGCATVINSPKVEILTKAIKKCLEDPDINELEVAKKVAQNVFDIEYISDQFYKSLMSIQ